MGITETAIGRVSGGSWGLFFEFDGYGKASLVGYCNADQIGPAADGAILRVRLLRPSRGVDKGLIFFAAMWTPVRCFQEFMQHDYPIAALTSCYETTQRPPKGHELGAW